jgi:hypothetical protein
MGIGWFFFERLFDGTDSVVASPYSATKFFLFYQFIFRMFAVIAYLSLKRQSEQAAKGNHSF